MHHDRGRRSAGRPAVVEDHRAVMDCLTFDWEQIRATIIIKSLPHTHGLLALINRRTEFDDDLSRRCDEMIGYIISEAIGKPWLNRKRTAWEAANDVCPDRRKLLEEIKKDDAVRGFRPDVEPRKAFGRLLSIHLNARRWEVLSRPEHKDRVWRILWEHDQKVKKEYRKKSEPAPDQCSDEHFKNIQRSIQAGENNARVNGIKLGTIRDYFMEFCPACRGLASQEYERSRETEPWNASAAMPSYLQERMVAALEKCIEQLDEPERGIVKASLTPDGGAAYRGDKGMSPVKFRQWRGSALCRLRACLKACLGSEEQR
jgi:hypothetical protein